LRKLFRIGRGENVGEMIDRSDSSSVIVGSSVHEM